MSCYMVTILYCNGQPVDCHNSCQIFLPTLPFNCCCCLAALTVFAKATALVTIDSQLIVAILSIISHCCLHASNMRQSIVAIYLRHVFTLLLLLLSCYEETANAYATLPQKAASG